MGPGQHIVFFFNPFRPTGPFLAPKLIVLIKFLHFKVLFYCFFMLNKMWIWHREHVQVLKIEK